MKSNSNTNKTNKKSWLAPVAGLGAGALVLLVFNAQLLSTQLYLWFNPITATAAISAPEDTSPAPVTAPPEPKLIIEKLGVEAPVIYDMDRIDEPSVQKSLEQGVLQFADTALPGQKGNIVIVGHSSNVPWAAGGYKYVFTLLHELKSGDRIILNYQSIRYAYEVSGSKVVSPYDVSVLQQTETPQLTLITCTPLGTNTNRLIVSAKQISPDPSNAVERPEKSGIQPSTDQTLPGQGVTPLRLR